MEPHGNPWPYISEAHSSYSNVSANSDLLLATDVGDCCVLPGAPTELHQWGGALTFVHAMSWHAAQPALLCTC